MQVSTPTVEFNPGEETETTIVNGSISVRAMTAYGLFEFEAEFNGDGDLASAELFVNKQKLNVVHDFPDFGMPHITMGLLTVEKYQRTMVQSCQQAISQWLESKDDHDVMLVSKFSLKQVSIPIDDFLSKIVRLKADGVQFVSVGAWEKSATMPDPTYAPLVVVDFNRSLIMLVQDQD